MTFLQNTTYTNLQKANFLMQKAFETYEAATAYSKTIGHTRSGFNSLYSQAECLAANSEKFYRKARNS